jgi:hypothetical protein
VSNARKTCQVFRKHFGCSSRSVDITYLLRWASTPPKTFGDLLLSVDVDESFHDGAGVPARITPDEPRSAPSRFHAADRALDIPPRLIFAPPHHHHLRPTRCRKELDRPSSSVSDDIPSTVPKSRPARERRWRQRRDRLPPRPTPAWGTWDTSGSPGRSRRGRSRVVHSPTAGLGAEIPHEPRLFRNTLSPSTRPSGSAGPASCRLPARPEPKTAVLGADDGQR